MTKMKCLIKTTFLLLVLFSFYPKTAESQQMNKGIYSSTYAKRWQDALISGNGSMGILVFGDPENERIIFNHEFLYEPIGSENIEPPDIAKYLPQTRKFLYEGKYEEAINYSIDMAREEGFSKLLWTDPYHPALVMKINQPTIKKIKNYTRSINFESGEVVVSWQDKKHIYSRSSFVSRADNLIVQKFSGNDINCSILLDMQGAKRNNWATRREIPYGIEEPIISSTSEWLTFRLKYKLNERGYEMVTKVVTINGKSSVDNNVLKIQDANEVLLISRIIPLENFALSQIESVKEEIERAGTDYNALLKKHTIIHKEIFDRVEFDIYPDDAPRHSVEELIAQQNANSTDINPELLEDLFYMGRYALLSSSGQNPPNLMGIWNGQWRPAWSGDFTTDANINLQISAANIGNMKEAIMSYMLLLERIADDWEINARNIYGVRGYLAGTRTSGRRGLHTHFSISFPGHFWLAGAEWLLLPCYEYYQVSGDREFLEDRLLPMMEKTALFFEDFLIDEDNNGDFIFAPSYSPENQPKNQKVQASVNALMDIAAAKEVFTNLIVIYKELEIKPEKINKYQEVIAKMPPYLINEDGALKEWAIDDLEDNYNHRHVSHLYPVWPGHEINPEDTPELYLAAITAMNLRGKGNMSAHGVMHSALIRARLKMPKEVYKNSLFLLTNNFIYNGMFTSHNPNLRIYNSDALCSLPAVILESLIYSKPGLIEILPGWDDRMPAGKVNNVRCRTNALVKELSWDMDKGQVKVKITSGKAQNIKLMLRNRDGILLDTATDSREKLNDNITATISFKAGETKDFIININSK